MPHCVRSSLLRSLMRRLLLLVVILAACKKHPSRASSTARPRSATSRPRWRSGRRIPGTEAHQRMAAWLDSLLRQRADTLVVQQWTHVTAQGRHAAAHQLRRPLQSRGDQAAAVPGPLGQPPDCRQPHVAGLDQARCPAPTTAARASRCCSAWPTCSSARRRRSAWTCCSWTARTTATSPKTPNDVLIGSRYYAAHQVPGPTAALRGAVRPGGRQGPADLPGRELAGRRARGGRAGLGHGQGRWATRARSSPRPSTR